MVEEKSIPVTWTKGYELAIKRIVVEYDNTSKICFNFEHTNPVFEASMLMHALRDIMKAYQENNEPMSSGCPPSVE